MVSFFSSSFLFFFFTWYSIILITCDWFQVQSCLFIYRSPELKCDTVFFKTVSYFFLINAPSKVEDTFELAFRWYSPFPPVGNISWARPGVLIQSAVFSLLSSSSLSNLIFKLNACAVYWLLFTIRIAHRSGRGKQASDKGVKGA